MRDRKKYYAEHKEQCSLSMQKYYKKNKEKIYKRKRLWEANNKERVIKYRNEWRAQKNKKLRKMVIEHYGNKCACCRETTPEFLEIDHINGGGRKHLREIKIPLVDWIVKNNFPTGFQILCSNCNHAKYICGECPHKKKNKNR